MKKYFYLILCINFITLITGCKKVEKPEPPEPNSPDYVYPEWFDTITSFGKRKRIAILKRPDFNEQGKTIGNIWDLYDQQLDKTIDEEINHSYKNIAPFVYTFGKNGYTKLNYETGEYIQSKDPSDFSEEDQKILENFNPIS